MCSKKSRKIFEPVTSTVDFPALERDIMAWWSEHDIIQKYLTRNENSERRFSFVDGPITANNPMGVHHGWGRTYKDVFLRYRTMRGFKQRYQNGFDGQGLWIEVEVEKELGFKSKRDIEEFGIDKFVELCKQRVMKFADLITQQSIRLGYWMDWDNSYHTMSDENNYTIWHFLKTCHERGWIYEGRDVMPWCPRCGTGLSEHEIVTEGYREIVHPGLFVRFPLLDRGNESILVWTTTPWTLSSNTAAAVHPERTYTKVQQNDIEMILMKSRLHVLRGDYKILKEMPGKDLVGLRYRAPFAELPIQSDVTHRVIEWEDVNENEGTGIVHIAPGAGKEDFALAKKFNLDTIAPLDEFGQFVDGFDWLSNMSVFDVNQPIYDSLKKKGILYHIEDYPHRYPVCWRCDSELVFRLVDEWFISMKELRSLIAEVTRKIRWIPEFGLQRELDWLRNMDDWMISKKRYWGLALPIYKCQCGNFDILGSEQELKDRAIEGWDAFNGHSPHRPWIDSVKIRCSDCGEKIARIRDVGNPWLDAGIVPFSTLKYRHDPEHWKEWFPSDWISESFPGQFRNWFYSLLTMSTVLENSEPFRTVFSYALMKDSTGEEMHKSKGNAIWFHEAAEQMGVDAMRWLFILQNPAANLNFGYSSVDEVRKRFIIPLWNVYSFFITYANIDEYDPSTAPPKLENRAELDRWIISELNRLILEATESLENYNPAKAGHSIERFVESLSNWYVRRSRRRFWKSGFVGHQGEATDVDKLSAYSTLYECLITLTKLIAPFMPFMAESMYQNLVRSVNGTEKSIHLEDYPIYDPANIDLRLSEATRLAIRISSLGRAARSRAGIKVRQPLGKLLVKLSSPKETSLVDNINQQILEELNVKELVLITDDSEVMEFKIQANMALLGPKYGKEVGTIVELLSSADPLMVNSTLNSRLPVEIGAFTLEPEEVTVTTLERDGYSGASEGGYTVSITTTVTSELALEGLARELVHLLQNMRRSAGFNISDRISTYYLGDPKLDEVVSSHGEYIKQETLSVQFIKGQPEPDAFTENHKLDGLDATLAVKRHN